jgi:hypothetical protein
MPVDSELEILLNKYNSFHPQLEIPEEISKPELLDILKKSQDRKIIFAKGNESINAYFEDKEEEESKIPNWNKLLGCGG